MLNACHSLCMKYASFVRLSNNPGANQQCKSPKKASWSSDQKVHTPSGTNTGVCVCFVSVENQYKD